MAVATAPKREAEAQKKPEADTEQARMRQGLAEVGHAPPDDETADGAGNQRDAEAGQQRAPEEGLGEDVKHARACRDPPGPTFGNCG